ncbi:hypothetical protein IscW_ISCW020632, partial [Ixodes scapularis]
LCNRCGPASPHVARPRAAVTQKPRLQHTPQWGPVDVRTRWTTQKAATRARRHLGRRLLDGIQQAVVPQLPDTPYGIAACAPS